MGDGTGLAVNDVVCTKKARPPIALWRVHAVHRPTIEGEKLLVSLRPLGKPNDKDYEGWPMHKFHTIEAARLEKVEERTR